MRVAGRDVPAWVILAGVAGVAAAGLCWAQYAHAGRVRDGAPDWLRAGQPPDVAVWQLPAALAGARGGADDGAGDGTRARSWPPAWTPVTGAPPPAWTWAGGADVDGPQ